MMDSGMMKGTEMDCIIALGEAKTEVKKKKQTNRVQHESQFALLKRAKNLKPARHCSPQKPYSGRPHKTTDAPDKLTHTSTAYQ